MISIDSSQQVQRRFRIKALDGAVDPLRSANILVTSFAFLRSCFVARRA